jgi:hypothetical protein
VTWQVEEIFYSCRIYIIQHLSRRRKADDIKTTIKKQISIKRRHIAPNKSNSLPGFSHLWSILGSPHIIQQIKKLGVLIFQGICDDNYSGCQALEWHKGGNFQRRYNK